MTPKKKLAIGRNVFCESDEDKDDDQNCGYSKVERKVFVPDERQGFKPKPKENSRWKRWQELSRKTGDEDDLDEIAKFPSPSRDASPEPDKDLPVKAEAFRPPSRLSNVSSTSASESQQQTQQQRKGMKVNIKTFENEEVGIMTGGNGLVVLFHINQVWINHPSVGYCNFLEVYPKCDLSKLLYPGRSALCWARSVAGPKCNYQATVVWLEGEAPGEEVYRTPDLLHHLDLQLAEFLSGRLASLHTLTATPSSLRSVGGVVQEWVSHEVGVVRLDEEDGGVALFHIGQAWAYKSCWVPYTSVMTKPAHLDYLALGTSVLLAVR